MPGAGRRDFVPGARFNEAAGADPADADYLRSTPAWAGNAPGFNEAAGADPADALRRSRMGEDRNAFGAASMRPRGQTPRMRRRVPVPDRLTADRGFNEAAGADPADAYLT